MLDEIKFLKVYIKYMCQALKIKSSLQDLIEFFVVWIISIQQIRVMVKYFKIPLFSSTISGI